MRSGLMMMVLLGGMCFGAGLMGNGLMTPPVEFAGEWFDAPAVEGKLVTPRVVFRGRVFGGMMSDMVDTAGGMSICDGQFATHGTVTPTGANIDHMWGIDDVGIFAHSTTAVSNKIIKSPNGLSAFVDVIAAAGDNGRVSQPRNLVDCGRHLVNTGAGTWEDRRVLLYFEYNNLANTCKVWVSSHATDATAGDAGTWAELFGVAPGIRHYHGGVFVKNKGLYVLTGDDDRQCSILYGGSDHKGKAGATHATVLTDLMQSWVTNELIGRYVFNTTTGAYGVITGNTATTATCSAGLSSGQWTAGNLYTVASGIEYLLRAPATWFDDKWLLGTNQRAAWEGVVKTNDILIGNTQDARTVDLVSSDGRYGYYIPDQIGSAAGNPLIKVDFFDTSESAAGKITFVKTGLENTGWYGGASRNGLVYITTISYWDGPNAQFYAKQNPYMEIWCIDPATDAARIVKRVKRIDYEPSINRAPDATSYNGAGLAIAPMEFGDTMIFGMYKTLFENVLGHQGKTPEITHVYGKVGRPRVPEVNVLVNGNFAAGATGWNISVGATFNNVIGFNAGSAQFLLNDVIAGTTSGATAKCRGNATKSSGEWDGSAVGYVGVTDVSGVFVSGEPLTSGAKTATLTGFNTCQIIDNPVGSGKVLQVVQKSTGLPWAMSVQPMLTPAQRLSLMGYPVSYKCKIYLHPDTVDTATLQPSLVLNSSPGNVTLTRNILFSMVLGQWHELQEKVVFDKSGRELLFQFRADNTHTDNDYIRCYVTDFSLIRGGSK